MNNSDKGSIYGRALKIRKRKQFPNNKDVNPPPQTDSANDGKGAPPTNTEQKVETYSDRLSGIYEEKTDAYLLYKTNDSAFAGNIPNYLKTNNYREDTDEDPYIALIRNFGVHKPLLLRAADFAYLRDLGVYPINRLWILRRFPENVVVPNNLISWSNKNGVEAISTVVGWIKPKEDSEMFNLSFNENWIDQSDWIDKVFSTILQNEFGMTQKAFVPVPGWSQGILFGILKAMGLTSDFDAYNPPTGDPNVLRQAKMRDITRQGLETDLSMTLETSYEQKYINGIDPGMAMMDILTNLFKMGTSDQKFLLGNSPALQNLLSGINNPNCQAWLELGKELLRTFIQGLQDFLKQLGDSNKVSVDTSSLTSQAKDEEGKITGPITGVDTSVIQNAIGNIAEILLAGTISKYRWLIRGSIGAMTGMNTTPWHLTVGNPYSPILNMGNILVKRVTISPSNELGFNDMPMNINVSISVELGRPLGKTELERMFNNGYARVYASSSPTVPLPSTVTGNGVPASTNVSEAERVLPTLPGTMGNLINNKP